MHPHPRSTDDRSYTREEARAHLQLAVARPDPVFSTTDPQLLRNDAAWRLQWIDCAPEGAWHQVAVLQDKLGIPCGMTWSELVGPGRALREARVAHGVNPFSGVRNAQ